MTAAAVTAVAAVPLVAVLVVPGGSSDALANTRDATTLELRIADTSADAAQMTRELNDAGIRGRVLRATDPPAGACPGAQRVRSRS